MTKHIKKIIIRNEFDDTKTLYLEPWGEDYGMLPSDEFEIIAKNVDDEFYFQIDLGKDVIVYAEGQVTDISVYQNNELLQCGHNRK